MSAKAASTSGQIKMIYNLDIPKMSKWLLRSQKEVLDKFSNLSKAFTDGKGNERIVYIPGFRDDRVLLVAHADTCWGNIPIELEECNGVIYSSKANRNRSYKIKYKSGGERTDTGIGIGADDRAGCAIVWALRKLGHSILITSGEEQGCIASKKIMQSDYWKKEINDTHQFAVEFDRKNRSDIVFYDVATNAFVKYVKEQTGFKPDHGFSTDIKHLCKDICGVNMSVGYVGQHGKDERLVIEWWKNSLMVAHNWLSQQNLPKFNLNYTDKYTGPVTNYQRYGHITYHGNAYSKKSNYVPKVISKEPVDGSNYDTKRFSIVCPTCKMRFKQETWLKLELMCPGCHNYT